MASYLRLKDDIDEVRFVGDTRGRYNLLDGSFSAPPPDVVDIRSSGGGGRLVSRKYTNRTISFSYLLRVDTDATPERMEESIGRVDRMLERAISQTYLDGDAYERGVDYAQEGDAGVDTGTIGLILVYRMGAAAPSDLPIAGGEAGGSFDTYADQGRLTFNVISGTQEIVGPFSVASDTQDNQVIMEIRVELECEPYALGEPRLIEYVAGPGFSVPLTGYSGLEQRVMIIDGADILGDAPALTRIHTHINNGTGIIMARDAGNSMLLAPSYPIFSGTGFDDMFAWGQSTLENELDVRIKITSEDPDRFDYSFDGGLNYSGAPILIQQHNEINITNGFSVMFFNDNGHTTNDTWSFRSGQSYLTFIGSPRNVGIGESEVGGFVSETGAYVGDVLINVPRDVRGKYKLLVEMDNSKGNLAEYQMKVNFRGYDSSLNSWIFTRAAEYEWVREPSDRQFTIIDLGVLDFSPRSMPHFSHPGATTTMWVSVYTRGSYIDTAPHTIAISRAMLIPVEDRDSFLWSGWVFDGHGREVYSNYDYNDPYIAKVSASVTDVDVPADSMYSGWTASSLETTYVLPLDESHVGNPLTLVPGVQNTLIFAPTWSGITGSPDFREAAWSTNLPTTRAVTIAIRERHLFVR